MPRLGCWNGPRDAEKGGKSKGGSKGLKDSSKGGKGKELYEVAWSGDFNVEAGCDGCSASDTAGTWTGASELADEQARAASSPWADQPALARPHSQHQAHGRSASSLLVHLLCVTKHRNRFAALEKEEDANHSRGMLVASQMIACCQHCWEPSCGEYAVAGFAPRPRPKRRKTHWTKFADTDDAATQE